MNMIEQIKADRIVAFKAKENIKKNLLGCLIGDSTKEDKEPSDLVVLSYIKKFIDGAKIVQKNTEPSDYEYYKASIEIEILESYRPKQMTEEEIITIITAIKVSGDTNLGIIMKYFKDSFPNLYDGAVVSKIAKEILK